MESCFGRTPYWMYVTRVPVDKMAPGTNQTPVKLGRHQWAEVNAENHWNIIFKAEPNITTPANKWSTPTGAPFTWRLGAFGDMKVRLLKCRRERFQPTKLFWCWAKVSDIHPRLPPPPEFYFFCLCRSTSPTQRPAAYLVGLTVHQPERTPLSSPARAHSLQPSFTALGTSRLSIGTILFCHSADISCFWGTFSGKNADKWIWKSEFKWGQVYFVIRDEWPIGSSRGNSEFTAYVLSAGLIQNVT